MLRRSDVLALLRVAESSARGRAEHDHAVSAHRVSSKPARFPAKDWRAKYLTQWPLGFDGWIWTVAGALSVEIVPPSIRPATLDAAGREASMRQLKIEGQDRYDALLRLILTDDQPSNWDGQPLVALKPSHGRPIVWVDARLRPLLTKLEWYGREHEPVAGFDLEEPRKLQALIMPVWV